MKKMNDGFFEANDSKNESSSDYFDSKKLLTEMSMKRYGIRESDLYDISIVKQKIRESNIDGILG